jgi:hypothetical protein
VDAVKFFVKKLKVYKLEDLRDVSNNTHLHRGARVVSNPFGIEPDDHQTPSFVSEYLGKLDAKRPVSEVRKNAR